MTPTYNRDFDPPAGVPMALSPLVTRLLAPNPGPFTFRGTGVYIVGAAEHVVVIDPGPLLAVHMAALKAAIGARRVSHILVTHTHRDHSEAANALKEWSGARTYGFGPQPHPSTSLNPLRPSPAQGPAAGTSPSSAAREGEVEEADDTDFVPDVRLADGSVVLGDGVTLTALHTPGHAANHLCFALAQQKAMFSGDHVMGWSSSVIAPPDGDMADYMESLERLIERDDAILYPTHGAPIGSPGPYLKSLLQHRRDRESQVLAQLAFARARLEDLVAAIYPGLDPLLRGAAALTIAAHLKKLEAEGRVWRDGERWRVTVPPGS